MDNNQEKTNPSSNNSAPVPEIAESELKMPEDKFSGVPEPTVKTRGPISPLLISLLVVSLALLGVVVVWGEEILDMIMPPTPGDTVYQDDMMLEEEVEPTPEEDIAALEEELDDESFDDIDADLAEIEAQMDAEMATGTQ